MELSTSFSRRLVYGRYFPDFQIFLPPRPLIWEVLLGVSTLDSWCSAEHCWHMTPQELQDLLDELEASRASRRRCGKIWPSFAGF
jgi:hypothetical protein